MKKYSQETIVGVFLAAGLLCVGYLSFVLGGADLFGGDGYTLKARFSSVSGLRFDSPVEMFGMEIGHVTDLTINQERQVAEVTMRLDREIKVYDDAVASIKTSGLIGDRFVEIDPGGGGDLLKAGETIIDTESPVDIIELVSKYAFGDVGGE